MALSKKHNSISFVNFAKIFVGLALLPAMLFSVISFSGVSYAASGGTASQTDCDQVPAAERQACLEELAQASAPTTAAPSAGAASCGAPDQAIQMSIDIGCKHEGNPIMDATFAIIRFLSDGVGLVVVGSIVYAGIQFSSSKGDPQATAKAITRLRSSVIALVIFIFGYAILNYVIPTGFLK